MNDIDAQAAFVVDAVNRILCQIDLDILSPTFGCAHLAHWRDKTSDFADMRCQEVMLPLSLLYANDYPYSRWKNNGRLKYAIEALLNFWCKNQYSDGSMDEWYKGERAFAAAAFSTHAVARTLIIIKNMLSKHTLEQVRKKLRSVSLWLMCRDDLFKTNHQAVGVAALAWAAEALEEVVFRENAKKKLNLILAAQTREGWFPEIGCMDVGYTFLTTEFIVMTMDLWGNWNCVEQLRRAFDFACEWIHPDFSVGKEYGICQNTYLSRIAVILLSGFSGRAAYIRRRLEKDSFGFNGYSSSLADDLRLLRWAYQPLLAYDYNKRKSTSLSDIAAPPLLNHSGRSFFSYDEAGMARFTCAMGTGIFASAAGGLIRFFNPVTGNSLSDYGYAIGFNKIYATNCFYHKNTVIIKNVDSIEACFCICCVNKFIPSFWMRFALHMFCATALGSRIIRKVIDTMRKKIGTPINQSSANLSASKSIGFLSRRVLLENDGVAVKDTLILNYSVNTENIFFLESMKDNLTVKSRVFSRSMRLPTEIRHLEVIKYYHGLGDWVLKDLSVKAIK